MHLIGWSTGALLPKGEKTNYPLAIEMLNTTPFTGIELGVLREWELPIFLDVLPSIDLEGFDYVSMHACKLKEMTDRELFDKLDPIIDRCWNIIVHPSMMRDYGMWAELGDLLLVENMENRDDDGRTVEEMQRIFDKLPDANMCFDIGHAKQLDPTMKLGRDLCSIFAEKVKEIHLSEVDLITCAHKPIDHNTLRAFGRITDVFPDVPIILEYKPLTNLENEVEYITKEFPIYGMKLNLRKAV